MKSRKVVTFLILFAVAALLPVATVAADPLKDWSAAVAMGYYNCNMKFQSATVDSGPNPAAPVQQCVGDESKKEKAAFEKVSASIASKPKALALAKELHAAQMAGLEELPGLVKLPAPEAQARVTKARRKISDLKEQFEAAL